MLQTHKSLYRNLPDCDLRPINFQFMLQRPQSGRLRYKRPHLEDYGTKTQSGRLRYKDACAMMHTVDLAIIRVQIDKGQKLDTPS